MTHLNYLLLLPNELLLQILGNLDSCDLLNMFNVNRRLNQLILASQSLHDKFVLIFQENWIVRQDTLLNMIESGRHFAAIKIIGLESSELTDIQKSIQEIKDHIKSFEIKSCRVEKNELINLLEAMPNLNVIKMIKLSIFKKEKVDPEKYPAFQKLTKLKTLWTSPSFFPEIFKNATKLLTVEASDSCTEYLCHNPNLKELTLTDNGKSDFYTHHIQSEIKFQLESFSYISWLGNVDSRENVPKFLDNQKQLVVVDFCMQNLECDIQHILKMKQLTKLKLQLNDESPLKDEIFEVRNQNVKHLNLTIWRRDSWCIEKTDQFLKMFPGLKMLKLTLNGPFNCSFDKFKLDKLAHIESIELTFNNCHNLLKSLHCGSTLTTLNLDNYLESYQDINDLDWEEFDAKNPNIKKVSLSGTFQNLTAMLCTLSQLEHLEVDGFCGFYEKTIAALAKCSRIKKLEFKNVFKHFDKKIEETFGHLGDQLVIHHRFEGY